MLYCRKHLLRVKTMRNNKIDKERKFSETPCMDVQDGQPEDCNELVNRYGRCNVQLTCATDNEYPAIAQGLSEETEKTLKNERDEWLHRNGKESGGKYKH